MRTAITAAALLLFAIGTGGCESGEPAAHDQAAARERSGPVVQVAPEAGRYIDADHVHYVPLRSLIPVGAHNLVAAGRCVDGDAAALSSVRVMGPCAAMGFAAAHAVDLAAEGGVQRIDPAELRERVKENVEG